MYASALQNLEGILHCCLALFIGGTGIAFIAPSADQAAEAKSDKGRVSGE